MERDVIRAHVRDVLVERLGAKRAAPATPTVTTPGAAREAAVARVADASKAHAHGKRDLVVEDDVLRARAASRPIVVGVDAIVTPLADETARRLGVKIERRAPPTADAPAAAAPSPAT